MNKIDLRKELKSYYQPSTKQVTVVDVPAFQFAMIDGEMRLNTARSSLAFSKRKPCMALRIP
jgi:hypothetical protein